MLRLLAWILGVRRRVIVSVPRHLSATERERIVDDVRAWVNGELDVVAVTEGVEVQAITVPRKVK